MKVAMECPKCHATFASRQSLQRHEANIIPCDQKPHKCPVCSRTYARRDALDAHRQRCKVGGRRQLSIEDAREVAEAQGGECLSDKYANNKTKMEWKCQEGHVWKATLNQIKDQGTWCPKCAAPLNQKKTLEDMQKFAAERGGVCLSTAYKHANSPLRWQCEKGHVWSTSYANAAHNRTWCPDCVGHRPFHLSLEDAKRVALERGGECLSTCYDNASAKLLWRCTKGHEWLASYNSVGHLGHWCPYCLFKNEAECRALFEELLCRPFPKVRPDWLEGLELDGYNEKLRLAFEYQGEQHYRYVPYFHRNGPDDLDAQKERDATKLERCFDEWVTLVVIPYTVVDKRDFIRSQLEELGYWSAGRLAM